MIKTFNGRNWAWNPFDEKLCRVMFQIKDLEQALKYVPLEKRRGAIQAGGAMGIWPYELSKIFTTVYTFEPDLINFTCLSENIKDTNNIISKQAALGNQPGFCSLKLHETEQGNAGAYYTIPSNEGIIQLTLDDEITTPIDLIQLDVEGRELQVLQGASRIISEFRPVIMLEEKALPQDQEIGHSVGQTERFLTDIGYKVVQRVSKDLIFVYDN